MPFWQRLVLKISGHQQRWSRPLPGAILIPPALLVVADLAAIVAVSIIAGLIWHQLFGFRLPSYIGGVIGGLTSIPVWEFMKRVGPQKK